MSEHIEQRQVAENSVHLKSYTKKIINSKDYRSLYRKGKVITYLRLWLLKCKFTETYHSIQSSCHYALSLYIKVQYVKDSLISELKWSLCIQKVRNHRNNEILSEKLCRKMPLSDLEARTVDQNQEKIRKQSWSDIKNQLNSWPEVKKSGITPSFHVWSMGTIVMPLIIVRLHFRHGELEKPVGKSVWNGLISTHITLYTVQFLGRYCSCDLKVRVQIMTISIMKKVLS